MNIRGIELLRGLKLPGPRKEVISWDLTDIDLERLYDGADKGATILAFDYREPINQNPLLEKNVRKYKIKREEFLRVWGELVSMLSEQGVALEDMAFVVHQTYTPEDISYSGRAAVHVDQNGFGKLWIDAVEGLRKGETDFDASFLYECPIIGGRLSSSRDRIVREGFEFPGNKLRRIVEDLLRIPGNPNVDFEVYANRD